MKLTNILTQYRNEATNAELYIQFAFSISTDNELRDFIINASILRLYIAWEAFLESSFISYMMDESSTNNNKPICFVTPLNREHAHNILIGTQKYVDWGNVDIVRRISNLYFQDGRPYNDILGSILTDLQDLRIIRNASAHLSSTTSRQLDAVASRRLNQNVTNVTNTEFLFEIDTENSTPNNSLTIFDVYLLKLDAAAESIVAF